MGNHSVVCTKLPALGLSREATTAAGNAITRLLGYLMILLFPHPPLKTFDLTKRI